VQNGADERLLRALAEELKLPLVQIARHAELGPQASGDQLEQINLTARMALKLVDGFLLSSRLNTTEPLPLEPVSLSSVLADAAHKLEPIAKQNNCDIVVSLGGKYGPAMAHRQSLDWALLLLGQSVIEGWIGEGAPRRHEVVLGAHRSANGLVAGVFDDQPGLSSEVLRRGRAFYGSARQTMPAVSSTNGAGVFVADSLMKGMAAPLHVARHDKRTGLAATLHASKQLQLV
jgi:hypothetical protein